MRKRAAPASSGAGPAPDRRVLGALALALALVAAVATPGLAGRPTSGTAVVGTIPEAPKAGQCRAPLSAPAELNSRVDRVPLVECSEPHSAEIIHVGELTGDTYPDGGQRSRSLSRAQDACDDLALRYVAGVRSDDIEHRVTPRYLARVTVPHELQWREGQRWYSCQVAPDTSFFPMSYSGSVRLAMLTVPPPLFAACANSLARIAPVPCDRPHAGEQLTFEGPEAGFTDYVLGGDAGDRYCGPIAAGVLGVADPTYGGKLTIRFWRMDGGASCWAFSTDGQLLTGTLIGLGNGPLPYA